jgi:spermidine synthase
VVLGGPKMQNDYQDSTSTNSTATGLEKLSPVKVWIPQEGLVSSSDNSSQFQTYGQSRVIGPLFFCLFTLSGFSGLIYESIWTYYLKLFLGHAAYAQTLVLMIFMGGMTIGSWFAARYANKWQNLLLAYAIVEGLIGLCAFGFHGTFITATALTYTHILPVLSSVTAASVFKWSLATTLILPQSILLGMTFPLMSGGLIRRVPEQSGSTIAMLYFTNSIGAVAGVLTSGFVLIGMVGLPGTMLFAGLLNLILALVVWLLSKEGESGPLPNHPESHISEHDLRFSPPLLLVVALITGASSFMYEIGWIRMLSLVLGSSTHSFEIMLSAFILGLALGGLWIKRRIDQLKDQLWFLGVLQLLMGLLALCTLPLYGNTFKFMSFIMNALGRTDGGYFLFNLASHAVSLFIMLPATFCAGMTLPLLTALLLHTPQREKAIGNVYASNTIGAIIGVFLAVHLLMPIFGLKWVISFGAILDIALGWMLLWKSLPAPLGKSFIGPLALSSMAIVSVLGWVHLDPYQMASGVFRSGRENINRTDQILFHQDGQTATVSLSRAPDGRTAIYTNGKPDASIQMEAGKGVSTDEITMTSLAALALGFNLEAKTVANIGMGSGMTSHILLASPYLQRLDTIEIEPAMVAAAQGFRPRTEAVFSDPRSHIHFEDAKTFFSVRKHQYDIIVSEPSNPWVSGVSGLFSQEFYQLLTNYLQTDGILVQWLHGYEFTMELFSSIVNAISPHFEDYMIFATNAADIVLIAKKQGALGSLNPLLFTHTKLVEELAKAEVKGIQDLEVRRIGNRNTLEPFFQSYQVPANSDYFPYVDLYAAEARFLRHKATLLSSLGSAPLPLLEMIDGHNGWLGKTVTPSFDLARVNSAAVAPLLRDTILGTATERPLKLSSNEQAMAHLLVLPLQCNTSSNASLWLDALLTVSEKLIPYLPPQELQPIWEKVESSPCVSHLPEEHQQWLTLMKAIGNRDSQAMVTVAHTLFAKLQVRENKERYRFLLATQLLGHLAQGKPRDAQSVWEEHRRAFLNDDSYLRLLVAHLTHQPK